MDARLQRRIQRYGWDLAAGEYEPLWQSQLAPAREQALARAACRPGDAVLDIACGTGAATLALARAVGPGGRAVGVDLSGAMVDAARQRYGHLAPNLEFHRMDAEELDLGDDSFDAVVCALGLMYMPGPQQAVAEMRRVLRPRGRAALAVWGERKNCGWSAVFPIVDAEVTSEVCPLFFRLGAPGALVKLCETAGFVDVCEHRVACTLSYPDAQSACNAAFVGGPVALAWSRFDAATRARVRGRYIAAIEPWRRGAGYRIPGEFVIASASVPEGS